ncbi:MAG TPA: glycosyltransferase family A protein [Candidatus Sulfotelmatobacter sp.]
MTNSPKLGTGATELPSVSVVIPAYNAAAYICATLESVFAQTFSSFEVVLVNDGSLDSDALEQTLQQYLSRIRYLKQANRGPSSARNAGIREAQGRYVAFLDSDDVWLPHHLSRQMEILQRSPELGLVYSNAVHLKQDRPVGVAFETVPQHGEPTLDALLAERCTVNTSSVVVRRDLLLQAGLFDESMNRCEDFDLWLRLSVAGVRMSYDREIQVCHRLGEGLTANIVLMKHGCVRAYQKMAARPELSDDQRSVIKKKLNSLELEIQTEMAKRSLVAGQYKDALSAAAKASSLAPGYKLRMAMIGLRCCPGLLRNAYSVYLRLLQAFKRVAKARSMNEIQIAGKIVNLDSLIGHRPLSQPNASGKSRILQ